MPGQSVLSHGCGKVGENRGRDIFTRLLETKVYHVQTCVHAHIKVSSLKALCSSWRKVATVLVESAHLSAATKLHRSAKCRVRPWHIKVQHGIGTAKCSDQQKLRLNPKGRKVAVGVANHKGEKCHIITLVGRSAAKVREGSYPTKACWKVPRRHAQVPAGEKVGRMLGCWQKCGSKHPPNTQAQPDAKVSPYQIKSQRPLTGGAEKSLGGDSPTK